MTKPVRVFLVDDSLLARASLRLLLARVPGIQVVGEAASGDEALRRVPIANPDVVLMDMVMPGMDGLETTRRLMASHPRPILIVSDLVGRDANLNFDALAAGALDLVRKPSADERDHPEWMEAFARRIRLLASVPVVTRRSARSQVHEPSAPKQPARRPAPRSGRLVVLGASTGGPIALHRLLELVGRPLGCPVLIVQHMTVGFTAGMARWLGEALRAPVELATHGTVPLAGTVYLAPDGAHLALRAGVLRLESPSAGGHCPSVDVLFESVARSDLAEHTVAALLTGMGSDGARGLLALRHAGAWTIAQDATTSVVYGMPRAASELGAACEVLPLERIAHRIVETCLREADTGVRKRTRLDT